MEELSLHEIVAIFARRKNYAFATMAVLFAIALAVSVTWSNYRSTATVQIEQSNVSSVVATPLGMSPGDMTQALADQRISQVEQTVTSADSLAAIIDKFNLYPEARKTMPIGLLTAKMRNKIKLDFIGSTLSNPAEALKASAEQLSAIAFTVSFDYGNPQDAQQVTNELVSRFLEEDLALRRRQAEETSAFLGAQIAGLESSMAEQEKKIAAFRAEHGESGPAALMFNQQASSSTAMGLQNIESQITANEGTEGQLRAQLATVDPYSRVIADGQVLTTPAIQLKALQAQYASLTSQYGPDHPDVIKTRHEIEALKAAERGDRGGGPSENTAALEAQIRDANTNLQAAKSTGGDDNPDVVALERKLGKLQDRLAEARTHGESNNAGMKHDADNPAYLQIQSQLSSAEEQHKALLAQRDRLMEQQTKYQQAIAQNPATEQQMSILSRDYDNEQLRYRELKEKKMAADMSEKMEADRKGQRLVLNSPPTLPTSTHPSKLLILAAGAVLSALGGIASVVGIEATSQSVHGAHQIAQLTGAAPLVIIPYIRTDGELAASRRLKPLLLAGGVAFLVLALIAFPYVIMPYDTLLTTIAQKLHFS